MIPPAAPLPDLPVTFRPLVTRIVLLTIGTTVFTVLTVIAVLLPADGAARWSPVERVAVSGSGLIILGVLTLLSRPRLTADRDGVTVVNLTTVRRLAWAQVVRVTLRPGDPWVTLDLADGTVLPVMAIQPGVAKHRALTDARTLRALAETFGTPAPAGDGPGSG